MSNLSEENKLYIEQMKFWLEEQEILEKQIKRTIDDNVKLAELNTKQLNLHQERVKLSREEFENWLVDNKIEYPPPKDSDN